MSRCREPTSNWGGNVPIRPGAVACPRTVEELSEVVAGAARVKPIGSAHSFSGVLVTDGTLVVTERLPRRVVDAGREPGGRRRVRVEGEWRLDDLFRQLGQLDEPAAVENSGSNINPTLFGSLGTGSHGSGVHWGSASHPDEVRRVELIDGTGELRVLDASRPEDRRALRAARVHLGGLGVLTAVEIAVRDPYHLHLDIEPGGGESQRDRVLTAAELAEPGLRAEVYWFPVEDRSFVLTRRETVAAQDVTARFRAFWSESVLENVLLGIVLRLGSWWPSRLVPPTRRVLTRLFDGEPYVDNWWQGLTGDRLFRAVSMEHALPVDRLDAALEVVRREVMDAEKRGAYWLDLPVNVRWSRSDDDTCMSAAHGRDVAWVDVSCYAHQRGHGPLLWRIEEGLRALGGRPHLGKVAFRNPREVWDPEHWGTWWEVRDAFDPEERLMNGFLEALRDGRELDPGLPREW